MAQIRKLAIYRQYRSNIFRSEDDSLSDICDRKEDFQKYEEFPSNEACTSNNLVDFIRGRELGNQRVQPMFMDMDYGTRHLLKKNILKEYQVSSKYLNKIFCSQWLSGQKIIFGTKCNKLIVLDLLTSQFAIIPSLGSSDDPENSCGIHSIQINPSRTLLATGAHNPNDVAVYKLPSMDPVCVGEGAHKDWVFDIVWLDDQFFVSGSRDSSIALWRVQENDVKFCGRGMDIPKYRIMRPLVIRQCRMAEKVRALTYNNKCQEIVALSLNAYLHVYDVETFRQTMSNKLTQCQENVCLTMQSERSVYAVGSKSHVTLIDTRTFFPVKIIPSNLESCSVRSTSFAGNILTIGTGVGRVLFYDIRSNKYLGTSTKNGQRQESTLKTSKGWVRQDETYRDVVQGNEYSPAIYTHCYDPSGTKLFAAGGPLPATLSGNYAGLWQ